MNPHPDPYETWKRRRADVPVPDNFADRVLARLDREPPPGLLRSRAACIGLGSLAGAVCLCRVLQLVVLFVVHQPGL